MGFCSHLRSARGLSFRIVRLCRRRMPWRLEGRAWIVDAWQWSLRLDGSGRRAVVCVAGLIDSPPTVVRFAEGGLHPRMTASV